MRGAKGNRPTKAGSNKRSRSAELTERPCLMPKCPRTTARPFGYCDRCWNRGRDLDSK